MLSLRTKIVLKLGGLALIVGLVGVLIVYVAFQGAPQVPDEPTPPSVDEESVTTLPGSGDFADRDLTEPTDTVSDLPVSDVADGGPVLTVQLTSSSIESPALTNGGQISYYDKRDGKFYTIDKNGNVVSLSSSVFPQADSIVFSNSGDQAAIEFPDGSNILYNFSTEKQTTLPSHWEDFAFSSDGSEVAGKSIGTDPSNRAIVITSSDGSQTQVVAGLGNHADDVTVQFSPSNDIVAFSETGSAQSSFGREEIYLIDREGEAVGSLIVDGAQFSGLWAPDGTHLLYSVAETTNERPTLWYTIGSGPGIGSERRSIPLETWVEKCTFKDETFIICAVPNEVVDNSGFDHRFITSPDSLYQINVTTGRGGLLAIPVFDTQMFNLSVSDDKSTLFFTDEFDRLNSINLR